MSRLFFEGGQQRGLRPEYQGQWGRKAEVVSNQPQRLVELQLGRSTDLTLYLSAPTDSLLSIPPEVITTIGQGGATIRKDTVGIPSRGVVQHYVCSSLVVDVSLTSSTPREVTAFASLGRSTAWQSTDSVLLPIGTTLFRVPEYAAAFSVQIAGGGIAPLVVVRQMVTALAMLAEYDYPSIANQRVPIALLCNFIELETPAAVWCEVSYHGNS